MTPPTSLISLTPRSWLYVPADRPDRIAKALAGDADAVVLDLEDAVAPAVKAAARQTVLETLAAGHRAYVRINDPGTPHGERDIAALAATPSPPAGIRVPKCSDPGRVAELAETVRVPVFPVIETALGVEHAFALARAHPLVGGISLGEANLRAELRADALAWPRSRIVVAARAAGLPSPPQSVWTAVRDLDGLRGDTEQAKRGGFFGRSVIHPAQVPVVHEVFTPTGKEVAWARGLVAELAAAQARGTGAWVDADGQFIDEAVVERARWVLSIAGAATDRRGPTEEEED